MTRNELVREAAKRGDFYIYSMSEAVDAIFDVIMETVADGEEVKIINFGVFKPKKYGPYTGKHVETGETFVCAAHMVPTFKPAASFKEAMKTKADK